MFRSTSWDSQDSQDVLKACMDFKTVYGVPLVELFKETPVDGISMVFLEEKLFKTWHFGRIGLMGDGKPQIQKINECRRDASTTRVSVAIANPR